MSTEEDLRRLVDEPSDDSDYTSSTMEAILLANGGDVNKAAVQIWTEKAAKYSQLVDMQEGDTRRSLGKLSDNALAMAAEFMKRVDDAGSDTGHRPTTVSRIIRP